MPEPGGGRGGVSETRWSVWLKGGPQEERARDHVKRSVRSDSQCQAGRGRDPRSSYTRRCLTLDMVPTTGKATWA